MTTLTAPSTVGHPRPPYRRLRVVRARLSLTGFCFAVLFFCASLTPSLMPRAWYLQGVVSGLTAVIGYGLGAPWAALAAPPGWTDADTARLRALLDQR